MLRVQHDENLFFYRQEFGGLPWRSPSYFQPLSSYVDFYASFNEVQTIMPLISPLPILYSFRRCPYAMRARLALWLAKLPLEIREVSLKAKPAELWACNPAGTVPVWVNPNGEAITESLEIMRWALAQRPELATLLQDESAQLALIQAHDREFKPLLDRYKYADRHPDKTADEHQYLALYWLQSHIEPRLADNTHLFANELRLADLAIVPFIRQCAAVNAHAFATQMSAPLQAWLAQLTGSNLLTECMRNYSPWQAGQAPVFCHLGE